jgi:hypothetical protein
MISLILSTNHAIKTSIYSVQKVFFSPVEIGETRTGEIARR